MYKAFERILNDRGITPYRVSKDTGISSGSLSDWKHGKYAPKLEKLRKLAKYLGVPLEELISAGGYEPKKEDKQ